MTSYKGLGPKKTFWPIKMKRSKPFCRQLTHYAETLLHGLSGNIFRKKIPTPIIRTKISRLTSCVISLAQYIAQWFSIIYPGKLSETFDTLTGQIKFTDKKDENKKKKMQEE